MLCAVLYGVRALWCAIGAYGTAAGGLGPCVVCGVWCVCGCDAVVLDYSCTKGRGITLGLAATSGRDSWYSDIHRHPQTPTDTGFQYFKAKIL